VEREPTDRSGRSRSLSRARTPVRAPEGAPRGVPHAPTVYDYGLIGNLHTAALASRFGSIDWACFPFFDSPSILAALLDREKGGSFRLAPRESYRSHQEYQPSTAILRTTFALGGERSLTVVDFMPVLAPTTEGAAPLIVRSVEATGGAVEVEAAIDPRPDYGRGRPTWTHHGNRWVGRSRDVTLGVRTAWPVRRTARGLIGRAVLEDGGRAVFELHGGADRPTRDSAAELLRSTEQFWTDWVHPPDSPIHLLSGRWHPWIERSEITLKVLSQADSGAFIAAPTTSLPEWPGGPRNWDYRYVWIRDAAFAAQSFALMGHVFEARSFLRWVVDLLPGPADRSKRLRVMYSAHGESNLTERVLPNLAGYLGSRPVRVGNAAALQFQLDIYGELLDAARLLAEIEPDSLDTVWPLLEGLADEVCRLWRRPDRGIWELRVRPAHYVYSKVMAWVALDRAILLGRQYGSSSAIARWDRARDQIRAVVLERGFDRRREAFVQAFERRVPDAANLRIPLVGFLAPDDPRIAGTIVNIERELSDGPFVYRFRQTRTTGGPEGAFLPCSFWLVDCLARAGERERARRNFELLLEAASPHGLLAEEYDPKRIQPLGNYPQAFSHIALLRAALALGLATIPASLLEQHPGLARVVRRRPSGTGTPIDRPDAPDRATDASPGIPNPRAVGAVRQSKR
jgi:alpha,alpha-trehalase